jgi:hypothetical protein
MSTDYEKLGVFYLGREFDPAQPKAAPAPILYDSRDLTTHAVCVGMTGSGKTGLCLALIEEAAIDGIPAICIDPKGDIANLLLTFPNLSAAEFAPWVDAGEAARHGESVEQYAASVADTWKKGLAEWDQAPERIARFRAAAEVSVYTPGASTGLGLSVLRSLAAPSPDMLADATALREQITTTVSAVLALLGRDADPLQSRDHILLSRIVEQSWKDGTSLDLVTLITRIQKPGLDKIGAIDLESFYPGKERMQLAMAVNNLLASPGFAAWTEGEPLDAQRLLYTPEGKPRIAIISIAHLSDPERMFVVSLVLSELVSWMRRQGGTSSLRALFYMDEIFGYFPPTANPPSKPPMLTLLKQARAFGLGCVLATQNPVDLDYRGLGNAGTWLIGRLQTERDKMRVVEGLTSALTDGHAPDKSTLEKLLSTLTPRVFLLRNAKEDAPRLMKSRWTLSYLRGPLTGAEVSRLMAPAKAAAGSARNGGAMGAAAGTPAEAARAAANGNAGGTGVAAPGASRPAAAPRPPVPPGIKELFLPAVNGNGAIEYRAMILGAAKLHFVDAKLGIDAWQTTQLLAPLNDDGSDVQWDQARDIGALRAQAAAAPVPNSNFASLSGAALRPESYPAWNKALAAYLYQTTRSELRVCDALKQVSNPGESEGDFRTRLTQRLREACDAGKETLRADYAPKLASLQDRLTQAQARAEREHSQLTQQKLQTMVSVGATILSAFLGKRAISATSVGRAATAVRSATRIGSESQDAARADESAATVQQKIDALKQQCDQEVAALQAQYDPAAVQLRTVQVSPRKADTAVGEVVLAWVPWRSGADGFPAPAC